MQITKFQLDNNLKYFRKIHIYKNLWMVSLMATKTMDGKFFWNVENCFRYLLSFVLVPVKVKDWGNE